MTYNFGVKLIKDDCQSRLNLANTKVATTVSLTGFELKLGVVKGIPKICTLCGIVD